MEVLEEKVMEVGDGTEVGVMEWKRSGVERFEEREEKIKWEEMPP